MYLPIATLLMGASFPSTAPATLPPPVGSQVKLMQKMKEDANKIKQMGLQHHRAVSQLRKEHRKHENQVRRQLSLCLRHSTGEMLFSTVSRFYYPYLSLS